MVTDCQEVVTCPALTTPIPTEKGGFVVVLVFRLKVKVGLIVAALVIGPNDPWVNVPRLAATLA